MPLSLATPGVFINEINAFPNSVVPVATAIPAFVGYTPRASYDGKSYTGIPVRLESCQDYLAYFAKLDEQRAPRPEREQYTPIYQPVPIKDRALAHLMLGDKPHRIVPDPGSIYYPRMALPGRGDRRPQQTRARLGLLALAGRRVCRPRASHGHP